MIKKAGINYLPEFPQQSIKYNYKIHYYWNSQESHQWTQIYNIEKGDLLKRYLYLKLKGQHEEFLKKGYNGKEFGFQQQRHISFFPKTSNKGSDEHFRKQVMFST